MIHDHALMTIHTLVGFVSHNGRMMLKIWVKFHVFSYVNCGLCINFSWHIPLWFCTIKQNDTHRIFFFIAKPTRCTSFSNLFYFVVALYMFRMVFPSIIRRLKLYIQHQVYIRFCWLLASVPASKQSAESVWHIPDAVMYSLKPLMMDRKTVRNTQCATTK
jgi:hypothetical protein